MNPSGPAPNVCGIQTIANGAKTFKVELFSLVFCDKLPDKLFCLSDGLAVGCVTKNSVCADPKQPSSSSITFPNTNKAIQTNKMPFVQIFPQKEILTVVPTSQDNLLDFQVAVSLPQKDCISFIKMLFFLSLQSTL